MDSSKKKALWLLIAGIILILVVLVVKFYNPNDAVKNEMHTSSIIDPSIDNSTDTIKTKAGAYERGDMDSAKEAGKKKVTFEELSNMTRNKDALGFKQDAPNIDNSEQQPTNENKKKSSVYEIPKTPPAQTSYSAKNSVSQSADNVNSEFASNKHSEKRNNVEGNNTNEKATPQQEYSSLGVSVASKKGNAVDGKSTGSSEGYIPAYLDEDIEITDKARPVFILNKDCIINGISLKKNAILYGNVRNSNSYFDIAIHNIKNVDGNNYEFDNVVVFNEKYTRGIVGEGRINKALKESGDQSANEASSSLGYNSSGNTGTSLTEQGINTTVNAITRSRVPAIRLVHGYKIYVKQLSK